MRLCRRRRWRAPQNAGVASAADRSRGPPCRQVKDGMDDGWTLPEFQSKRGKTRGGMILRFPGGRESDSFWECRGPGILTVCRTPS
jgi:hypothetical protein